MQQWRLQCGSASLGFCDQRKSGSSPFVSLSLSLSTRWEPQSGPTLKLARACAHPHVLGLFCMGLSFTERLPSSTSQLKQQSDLHQTYQSVKLPLCNVELGSRILPQGIFPCLALPFPLGKYQQIHSCTRTQTAKQQQQDLRAGPWAIDVQQRCYKKH